MSGDPSTDFRNDTNDWWSDFRGAWPELHEIVQDPVMGQSYRLNQDGPKLRTPRKCNPGGGMGRDLKLPNPEKEIWVEAFVKLSPTYTTSWKGPDCTAPDHKFIFFERVNSREGSTWRFKIGNQGSGFALKAADKAYGNQYYPRRHPRVGHGGLPNQCMNDVWLRWRWHLRGASEQGVADGHFEFRWVEMDDPDAVYYNRCTRRAGQMRYLALTPTDQHDGFDRLSLGVTFNSGPFKPQWWQWGEIRVWRDDPGWGW